jgi:adenosine deaminase
LLNDDVRHALTAMPKIELHRHLEGSVRLDTLVEIAREYGIEMPEYDVEVLRPFVQMMPGETRNAQHFLAKFLTLRQFYRSPEIIRRVAREAVMDAAADNIKYLELRFTPRALCNILNCSFETVIDWVCTEVATIAAQCGIVVRLILSMNRHESVEIGEHVLLAALAFRAQGVVAIDLAGNEQDFPAEPFQKVFEQAKTEGLGVTIHAGEWAAASNVRAAVERLHAARIGHGVRAIDDPTLCDWLVRRGTVLEVCPTSNVHSGVVVEWSQHPLADLYRRGILTTINTDDPLVSNITLTDELTRAVEYFSLSPIDLKQLMLNAAHAAFLPPSERASLVSQFENWLSVPQ